MQQDLLAQTLELVDRLPVRVGCPSCVGPVGETGPLAKRVAIDLLQCLIGDSGVNARVNAAGGISDTIGIGSIGSIGGGE